MEMFLSLWGKNRQHHARAVRNNKKEEKTRGKGGGGEWMEGEGYSVFTNAIRPEDLPVL